MFSSLLQKTTIYYTGPMWRFFFCGVVIVWIGWWFINVTLIVEDVHELRTNR